MEEPDDLQPLTDRFVSDAQAAGLSKADLEASLGDLQMFLSACIESAADNS
jgi:hypothetical protein